MNLEEIVHGLSTILQQLRAEVVQLHNRQGEELFQKGRSGEALLLFQKALALSPDSAITHNNLGMLYHYAGHLQESIQHLQAALTVEPYAKTAVLHLSEILKKTGRFEYANYLYSLYLQIYSEDEVIKTLLMAEMAGAVQSKEALVQSVAPLFTVIVPTYNQSRYLPAALDSLLAQSYPGWEVVVVNDGSTDDTTQVLEAYAARDRRIRIFHQTNGGVASALNTGLRHSRGEWICWLSSDDLFEPDKLAIHMEEICRHPDIRFFYSHFYHLDDVTGIKSSPDLWSPVPERTLQVSRLLFGSYIHSNSIAFHRDILKDVGYFNESLRAGQDYDMWLRISARYPSQFIDHRTCVTRWHPEQTTNEFPEAGSYDSAHAAIDFINANPFAAIFPLLNLNDPSQALSAIKEALTISISPAAIMHRCYSTSALLDRLHEWLSGLYPTSLRETITNAISHVCRYYSDQEAVPVTIRERLAQICNPSVFIYRPHNFFAEAANYADSLGRNGTESHAASLKKYLEQRGVETNNVKDLTSNKEIKVLFYYAGLHNSDHPWAGSSAVTMRFARKLSEMFPFLIHVTGDQVTRTEPFGKCTIITLPANDERAHFIAAYDIVVFVTHIRAFFNIPKPAHQTWLLHQHCWGMEPDARLRLGDIDLLLALSEKHRQKMVADGVPYSLIEVVSNGIDELLFYPDFSRCSKDSIMFAGAVVAYKGVHIILEAFDMVRKQFPYATLHIYGSSAMWGAGDSYEKQLREQELEGVTFYGEVPNSQMPEIYRRHDILCLPSHIESFGMVTIEAQACGCIPVVHDAGGTSETLQDGVTGFLYSPNTPDVLAEVLCRALSVTEKDPGIRVRAVDFVHEKFNLTIHTRHFGEILLGR